MHAGVRKLGSIERIAKQSVDAFVEAVGQKDALQELQVASIFVAIIHLDVQHGTRGCDVVNY